MDSLSQADDARSVVLIRQRVSQLLGADTMNPFTCLEEQGHPWSVNEHQRLDCPLLRIWDMNSGSQPDENNRMMSRFPDQRLDTWHARKTSLEIHLDNGIWEPTPYISFSKSASAIEDFARFKMTRKRGVQTLTVIDPAVRLRSGLPILDVAAEMQHYCIPDPYGRGGQYYIDHYVCLWAVNEDEVVGHYDWEELANTTKWYENVIMAAFRDFRGGIEPEPTPTHASTFDMSTMMESLPLVRFQRSLPRVF